MSEETKEDVVWLDFETVMKRLGLKRPELYRQVKDGKLKAEKKDRYLQFTETAVEEFESKRQTDDKTLLETIEHWETLLNERFPAPKEEEEASEEKKKDTSLDEKTEEAIENETKEPVLETEKEPDREPNPEPNVDFPARIKALVEHLLQAGIREEITDLYIDPLSVGDRILFRYGDALVDLGKTEACLSAPLRTALRDLGKLTTDGDEPKRRGIAEIKVQDKPHQILLEVAPTRLGDHVHVHFWGTEQEEGLLSLGYTPKQAKRVVDKLGGASGLVLLARGVGAADDLHHVILGRVAADNNLVVSCETGIFPKSEHLVQVAVDLKAENGLSKALDTAMGLEPDVLMVDMVSKPEDMKAIFSLLSMGGVVIAGIRALDMNDVIRQFVKAEMPSDQILKCLSFGIERIQIRRLCSDCKISRSMTEDEKKYWKMEKDTSVFDPVGCERCLNGYLDRRGIFGIWKGGQATDLDVRTVVRECLLDGEISPPDARQIYERFEEIP